MVSRWTTHPLFLAVEIVVTSVGLSFLIAPHLNRKAGEALQPAGIALVFVALIGGLDKIFRSPQEQVGLVAGEFADRYPSRATEHDEEHRRNYSITRRR